jgi:REP element-mobilizing transposase RayT
MIRGIERRRIFHDTEDYEDFLGRLNQLIPALGFLCFTWVLMPNHAHLALQTGHVPLPRLMARLGTGYACRFNRRHERVGHLVQNRYRARLVKDDHDLLGLIRYIHANPLRAGLVSSPEALGSFPWCGYGALVGERPAQPFEATTSTLCLVADEPTQARRALRQWMQQPIDSADFASRTWPDAYRVAPTALTELIFAVCTAHGLAPKDLGSGRRGHLVIEARSELAHRATQELGLSRRAVARAIGVSDSTVTRALARTRRYRKQGDGP